MLDGLPDPVLRMYAAIGHLTVHWSSAEYTLDHMIKTVHDRYGGDKIEPSPPISFGRKPKYLRKAFSAHPDLVSHVDRLNKILNEASEIADHRNWCIHGAVKLNTPIAPISKIMHGNPSTIATRDYSVDEIWLLSSRAIALGVNLAFFALTNIWVEGQDDLNNFVSKFLTEKIASLPDGETPS